MRELHSIIDDILDARMYFEGASKFRANKIYLGYDQQYAIARNISARLLTHTYLGMKVVYTGKLSEIKITI